MTAPDIRASIVYRDAVWDDNAPTLTIDREYNAADLEYMGNLISISGAGDELPDMLDAFAAMFTRAAADLRDTP